MTTNLKLLHQVVIDTCKKLFFKLPYLFSINQRLDVVPHSKDIDILQWLFVLQQSRVQQHFYIMPRPCVPLVRLSTVLETFLTELLQYKHLLSRELLRQLECLPSRKKSPLWPTKLHTQLPDFVEILFFAKLQKVKEIAGNKITLHTSKYV